MPEKFWLDTETYSPVEISHGTYAYAEADEAEIMLASFALGDGPVSVVDFTAGESMPAWALEALSDPQVLVWAHNAQFDRVIWNMLSGHPVPNRRWRCTAAQARSHSLPGSLDKLCGIFHLPEELAKKEGDRLIQLFCKPRPKNVKIRRATSATHPVEWARFKVYAGGDIVSMRELHTRMPKWNYA